MKIAGKRNRDTALARYLVILPVTQAHSREHGERGGGGCSNFTCERNETFYRYASDLSRCIHYTPWNSPASKWPRVGSGYAHRTMKLVFSVGLRPENREMKVANRTQIRHLAQLEAA